MVKLAVAIASNSALPSAFVVFRGFESSIRKAALLGYDGVELALRNAHEIDKKKISGLLKETNLEIACISTGQIYAADQLMFTLQDQTKWKRMIGIFKELIDLASVYGHKVNIGRVRGLMDEGSKGELSYSRFLDTIRILCDYAHEKNVTLLLEPINRYETNFINSVAEGYQVLKNVDKPNLKLMPDLFHMNIEDRNIGNELVKYKDQIDYIHLADSNRYAPGQGHIDFNEVFRNLHSIGYNGWLGIEILPYPDPDTAAKQAISYVKTFMC